MLLAAINSSSRHQFRRLLTRIYLEAIPVTTQADVEVVPDVGGRTGIRRQGGPMTRIIEHRQEAAPDEEVFELRVFQLRDGDVRGCVVPADLAVDLDMMADMSEPVAQAYLNALALCETESVATLWVHDPLGLFPPRERPELEL